jgi:ABC-type phosphate transport system permease subunit
VLPRLAQICIFTAMVLAMAPWALWKMFANLPPGFNGVAGVGAAFFSSAALLLALDAVATPMAFMRK